MSTRGHYIGEIIDEFANLRLKIEERGKLGLFDLHRHIEDYFKEIFNIAFDWHLKNLNTERSNAPGVDLGDLIAKICIQVTSIKEKSKIQNTHEKFVEHHKKNYDRLIVFIAAEKKKEYAFDPPLYGFNVEADIWDINVLLKNIIVLDLDKIRNIYEHVKKETARVRIELELPDFNGEYPTSITEFIEKIPKPQLGDMKCLINFCENDKGSSLNEDEKKQLKSSFAKFFRELQRLPRITRETIGFFLEHLEPDKGGELCINFDKIKKMARFDLDSEINILLFYNFISIDLPEEGQPCTLIWILQKYKYDYFLDTLLRLSKKNNFDFNHSLRSLDFRSY